MQQSTLILVVMIEPQPVGYKFARKRDEWPLHITLVPWFAISPDDNPAFQNALAAYAASLQSFVVTVGQEAHFGSSGDVCVNVISDQEPLQSIHEDLLDVVQAYGGHPDPGAHTWTQTAYRAHITHHAGGRRHQGDTETIASFSLVRLGEANACEVVSNYAFGATA